MAGFAKGLHDRRGDSRSHPGGDDWKRRAVELLKKPTGVSWDEMGVPKAWEDEPLWKRPWPFYLGLFGCLIERDNRPNSARSFLLTALPDHRSSETVVFLL